MLFITVRRATAKEAFTAPQEHRYYATVKLLTAWQRPITTRQHAELPAHRCDAFDTPRQVVANQAV
jgi:hypothetical protein